MKSKRDVADRIAERAKRMAANEPGVALAAGPDVDALRFARAAAT